MSPTGSASHVLREALRNGVNADGGWGYANGRTSRLEPTNWAMLALTEAGDNDRDTALVRGAMARLDSWQGRDGWLADVPDAPVNYAFNGLSAIAVRRTADSHRIIAGIGLPDVEKLTAALQSGGGMLSGKSTINRQNNALPGWPWHSGTSNWIEPTAWCTLALKKAGSGPSREARIRDAERMLADRCCTEGGWNYGNSNMLGKELAPYVPSTAAVLLAMQDRQVLPEFRRSATWLSANWASEPSPMALSLTLIALRTLRLATADVERALHACIASVGAPVNLVSCAQALYAMNGADRGYPAFVL